MKTTIEIRKCNVSPDSIQYIYLIDGVYHQQKISNTEAEAIEKAKAELKTWKNYKK